MRDVVLQGNRDPWSGQARMSIKCVFAFGFSTSDGQVVKPQVGFGVFADPDQPRTAV